ncbi:MAG: sodium-dependent transporter [Candidatus Merdivicinus sp.]|jgi:NSS family neurotransmitter:Na+ symporter
MQREKFSSRLGFVLISAGCAIGLGNVWRFPYITGKYGGAAFVLIYLLFLVLLAMPIMVMEFAVGRASQKSCAASFRELEPKGSHWHWVGYVGMAGNYLLMMFYTTIGSWMLIYFFKMISGQFTGLNTQQVEDAFLHMQRNEWGSTLFWMLIIILLGFGICSMGLKNGVERITKIMMMTLFAIMLLLAGRSFFLDGAKEGLSFYLIPNFDAIRKEGIGSVIYAAMGQAFFTLSVGMGSMAIFGSYIGKDRSLTGESINITVLDTCVAFMAGLIIFPACFTYGVNPQGGPGLVFITLPNVFNAMAGGRIWGALFFLFLFFAALSTIVAVFENLVSFGMDLKGWSRKKSVAINIILITLLSLPCLFGFNLLSGIQPFGEGSTIMDLEDFIVTNNVLPLGAMFYLLFCTTKYGWGWKKFLAEADSGKGIKFPRWLRGYFTFVLPVIIIFIFIMGYWEKFFQ